MSKAALEDAVRVLGSQTALARACGGRVRQGHVYFWLMKSRFGLPPEHCQAVAIATREAGRELSKEQLRPDVFGPVAAPNCELHIEDTA